MKNYELLTDYSQYYVRRKTIKKDILTIGIKIKRESFYRPNIVVARSSLEIVRMEFH